MDRVASYSPEDVVVVISQKSTGLVWQVSGYMEDSNINFERESEGWMKHVGIDNNTTLVHKANTSGSLTLSLAQSSSSNYVFQNLYDYHDRVRSVDGLFTVMVKDTTGLSIIFSDNCWIGKMPNQQFGSSVQGREWVIDMAATKNTVGGNMKFTPEEVANIEKLGGTVAAEWRI